MEASTSQRGAFARRRILYRGAAFAFATGSIALGMALYACGGTTGREGLSTPDSSVGDDGGDGGLDVSIQYIDRLLPDLYVAPIDSGGGGEGGPWPGCAPDLPVLVPYDNAGLPIYDAAYFLDPDGSSTYSIDGAPDVAIPGFFYEVPAVWLDDGGEAFAPDGSACTTRVWLGSAACDTCVKQASGGNAGTNPWYGEYGNTAVLPPCSDLVEAGVAVAGPGANKSRLELCQQAFNCIMASRCFATGTGAGCYCDAGCLTAGPNGVCGAAIQAACEVQGSTPADTTQKVANCYNNLVPPGAPGHAGGSLGLLFSYVISGASSSCLPFCTGDAGSN
jgi:hypothetical protein